MCRYLGFYDSTGTHETSGERGLKAWLQEVWNLVFIVDRPGMAGLERDIKGGCCFPMASDRGPWFRISGRDHVEYI